MFWFRLGFPPSFPFYPPQLVGLSKVYHIGFGMQGQVRLAVLDFWSAANRVVELIESIRQILVSPDPRHLLIPEVLQCYMQRPTLCLQWARDWTDRFATVDVPPCTPAPVSPPRHAQSMAISNLSWSSVVQEESGSSRAVTAADGNCVTDAFQSSGSFCIPRHN